MSAFLEWTDTSGRSRRMYWDLTVTLGLSLTQQITDHAVEQGANTVDHSRTLPDEVTLEVFVSNAPLDDLPDGSRSASFERMSVDVAGGGSVQGYRALKLREGNYYQEAFELLDALRTEATFCTLYTDYKHYDNMLLASITLQEGEDATEAATFQLKFRSVRIAVGVLVNAPKLPVAKVKKQKGKKDPIDSDGADQKKSVAKGLTDMLPQGTKDYIRSLF